ncbi:hypothetical protein GCM10010392_40650 [Streptomyces clavifer]|uniref:RNA polymerase sigma-70 factor (ECF subfamily) n=1 Tax=Streptomyces clavifer TaxID=68188 RepID=A0ABS4VJ12_9ACTN|nr:RNA polymerase sigma-70 factor (ECF subfamily) [Streptomyces clavifer]GHB09203.1 hypothetical protein GCM10010392_40650 [Streptomyces clavifer]
MLHTLALDVLDGRIRTIRSVINPDKLGHVGPVADAWAIDRELRQTRRPPVRCPSSRLRAPGSPIE